jgi:hypothetical protein
MTLPSYASDGVVEATLAMGQCHCRVLLVTTLPSLASSGAAEAMLVVARCCVESCWGWHYRVMLVMALLRQHWPWYYVAVESC